MSRFVEPLWVKVFTYAMRSGLICLCFLILYGFVYKEQFAWHHQYMRIGAVSITMLLGAGVIDAFLHNDGDEREL